MQQPNPYRAEKAANRAPKIPTKPTVRELVPWNAALLAPLPEVEARPVPEAAVPDAEEARGVVVVDGGDELAGRLGLEVMAGVLAALALLVVGPLETGPLEAVAETGVEAALALVVATAGAAVAAQAQTAAADDCTANPVMAPQADTTHGRAVSAMAADLSELHWHLKSEAPQPTAPAASMIHEFWRCCQYRF